MTERRIDTGVVLALDDLAAMTRQARDRGQIVVMCHGVFDLVHPGHLRHFAAAKREGDVLVVTVTPDRFVNKGPGRPFFPETLRAEMVAAIRVVDAVAVNRWPTATPTIGLVRPSVYVKGSEYADASADVTGKISDEAAAVAAVGGRIHFTKDITFSSSTLLNEGFGVHPAAAREYLNGVRGRLDAGDVIAALKALAGRSVRVAGEVPASARDQIARFTSSRETGGAPIVISADARPSGAANAGTLYGSRGTAQTPAGDTMTVSVDADGAVEVVAGTHNVRVPRLGEQPGDAATTAAIALGITAACSGMSVDGVALVTAAALSAPRSPEPSVEPVVLYKTLTALLK